MEEFYAHSREGNPDKSSWQTLEEHLRQTAEIARDFTSSWLAGDWGYLSGIWHDIGKYSKEFQCKINAEGGEKAHIKVDHSTAGAKHAAELLKDKGIGKVIAYVIAGHHGGLPDGISADSCLRNRLGKQVPDYGACPQHFLKAKPLALPFILEKEKIVIQISIFIRMLYSALVDADFLDTERFYNEDNTSKRQGYESISILAQLFFKELNILKEITEDTPVNDRRNEILNHCLVKAENDTGIYSLTVPTGGGKTLSSMAFALKHAKRNGLKRIIYVIPYTSIIEQNAKVFRDYLGNDAVLEHHCNFEPKDEDPRSRLASENWDAPIIVTTNVQFFESLFASRSSRCRKLHNIAESVVILDEVQTLPAPYLLPCLEVLKELTATYKTSIILCSATQPAVQKRADFAKGLEGVKEIIESPAQLEKDMKRTNITILGKVSDEDIAGRLNSFGQVLCVVNTRKHARNLYQGLTEDEGLHHLSALMCPVHRSQKLDEIRLRLKNKQTCRVVSTQLIEAGVDIDFPVVFRAISGIDSIAQAAGRCNREGNLDKGQVFVFEPECGIPPGHFRQTAQAAESVIRRYPDDILSLDAIEEYFELYYWTKGEKLDEYRIMESLHEGLRNGDFPFKTIAEKFQFIKDYMKPVVIPFDGEARGLIKSIENHKKPAILSRKLQKYSVSISPYQWKSLLECGSIEIRAELYPVLIDEQLYKPDIGLYAENPSEREPEELYI